MSNAASGWGTVSHRFTDLVGLLELKITLETRNLHAASIPSHGDIEPGLAASISAAHRITTASKDLRGALSAYAHRIHVPRPKVAVISEAQDTNAQGLARRYSARTQQAIEALIAGTADPEVLIAAFPSLTKAEAQRLSSGARGEVPLAASRAADADVPAAVVHQHAVK